MHTAHRGWLHCMCGAPCSLPLTFKHFKEIYHGTRFCFTLLYTPWPNIYWVSHQITQEMWGWSRDWTNKLPVFISYGIMNVSSTIFKILSDKLEATQIDVVIRRGKICLSWHTSMRNHEVRRFGFRFSLGFQYHSSMSEKQDLPLPLDTNWDRLFLAEHWFSPEIIVSTAIKQLYRAGITSPDFRRPVDISLQNSLWGKLQHISPRLLIALHRRCSQTV